MTNISKHNIVCRRPNIICTCILSVNFIDCKVHVLQVIYNQCKNHIRLSSNHVTEISYQVLLLKWQFGKNPLNSSFYTKTTKLIALSKEWELISQSNKSDSIFLNRIFKSINKQQF